MKKTSVYLTEHQAATLKRLADETGKSQAKVLRETLAAYDVRVEPEDFAVIACGEGDGRSAADIPEAELMWGFGEDDISPYMRAKPSALRGTLHP